MKLSLASGTHARYFEAGHMPAAERELSSRGFPGQLGLLKNCRDARGHCYGAQENYDAQIAVLKGPPA